MEFNDPRVLYKKCDTLVKILPIKIEGGEKYIKWYAYDVDIKKFVYHKHYIKTMERKNCKVVEKRVKTFINKNTNIRYTYQYITVFSKRYRIDKIMEGLEKVKSRYMRCCLFEEL